MSAYQPNSPGDILERSLVRGPVGGEALPARRVRAGGSRPQTLKPSTKRFPAATNRLPTLSGGKTARWPKSRRHLSHRAFATTANVATCRDLSQDFGETWRYPARMNPRRSSSRYDGVEFLP